MKDWTLLHLFFRVCCIPLYSFNMISLYTHCCGASHTGDATCFFFVVVVVVVVVVFVVGVGVGAGAGWWRWWCSLVIGGL